MKTNTWTTVKVRQQRNKYVHSLKEKGFWYLLYLVFMVKGEPGQPGPQGPAGPKGSKGVPGKRRAY